MSRRFNTTHWSLVVKAGDRDDPLAREALTEICETYWPPVYGFIRSQGHDVEAARDLTQGFFTLLLEKEYLKSARQDRGRFRSFLLTCVKRFLSDERQRENALKRGGQSVRFSLDVERLEMGHEFGSIAAETPHHVFEKRWALTVAEQVVRKLRAEAERSGTLARFERLEPMLLDTTRGGYKRPATELGVTEGALKVALHRLRFRFGQLLREQVAETVADPEKVDIEIRHILEVLNS